MNRKFIFIRVNDWKAFGAKSKGEIMTNKKTILVTGATGAQGGSVARYLLNEGGFTVRALTRNANSDKAAALKQAGAEMIEGDLANIESLRSALNGCYGVFGVTNFWEHFGNEYEQGKNLIDAVAEANVEHFVFSSLPPAKQISNGELEVPHFDIKAQLEEYARKLIQNTTFVHVAFYYENFLSFFPPQKQSDATYAFGFPQGDTALAGVSVNEIGGIVSAIFAHPDEYKGKTVGIVGDDLPPAKYAAAMTRHLNKTIKYNHIPREVFSSFGFPGAEDLANMFDFNRRFILERKADLATSRALYPQISNFETWLAENKNKFSEILDA
jgi:uncharacterized protein YbjT (DUF2867 family)